MKYSVIAFVAIALLCASTASASIGVGSLVTIDTSLPGGSGGQFAISDGGSAPGLQFDDFVTFCCELEETIVNGGTYEVAAIGYTNSIGNTLSSEAAYLYTQFVEGTLANFNPNLDSDSNGLQYGIWLGMEYDHDDIADAIGSGAADSYRDAWEENMDDWMAGYGGALWAAGYLGNVAVMQLVSANSLTGNQDQLVIVPEPASLLIFGALGLGLAFSRVRRRD